MQCSRERIAEYSRESPKYRGFTVIIKSAYTTTIWENA